MSEVEKLREVAIQELLDFFKMGNEEGDYQRARIAQATLSTVARLKGTERVRDATQFSILRLLAENPKELKQYLSTSLPDYIPAKALTSGKS